MNPNLCRAAHCRTPRADRSSLPCSDLAGRGAKPHVRSLSLSSWKWTKSLGQRPSQVQQLPKSLIKVETDKGGHAGTTGGILFEAGCSPLVAYSAGAVTGGRFTITCVSSAVSNPYNWRDKRARRK
eukprot:5075189-Amphidinium_carterae.1